MLQVVLVDCTHLHSTMIPRLNDIYRDIIEFVAEQSFKLAGEFIGDMKRIVQVFWRVLSVAGWTSRAGALLISSAPV